MLGGHERGNENASTKGNERANLPVWVPVPTDGTGFTEQDKICVDIRRLQQRSGCTNVTCGDVLSLFKQYLGNIVPKDFRAVDRKLRKAAGASVLRLNGCPECNRHVYHPEDKTEFCPHVKSDGTVCGHPRFGADGKPLEVPTLYE